MKILKRVKVPTWDILIVQADKGKLEFLSIGDYGKKVNVKCDVMGLVHDPGKVVHTKLLPLEEKWVITISTQYGCSMGCNFCDVPKVGPGINATYQDMENMIRTGLSLHPEVTHTKRLNVHFARMGEPTWNDQVLNIGRWLKSGLGGASRVHPVVSTMMPKHNKNLRGFINEWMDIKNCLYRGEAGLQLSINSTDETERSAMFNGNAHTLESISDIMRHQYPMGRKITLNFAVANYTIDPKVLLKYFDPENFIIKLTPMHKTLTAVNSGIKTEGDYDTYYPYKEIESSLKAVGFDVLVFIASREEDESRITCGNAILSE